MKKLSILMSVLFVAASVMAAPAQAKVASDPIADDAVWDEAATAASDPIADDAFWDEAETITFTVPADAGMSGRAAAATVRCGMAANNPHRSSNAGVGIIAKLRASCTGSCGCAPTVKVRVQGILKYSTTQTPLSSYKTVKSLDTTLTITTDGTIKTFYIPPTGQSGYNATGWYMATGTLNPLSITGAAVSDTKGPLRVVY